MPTGARIDDLRQAPIEQLMLHGLRRAVFALAVSTSIAGCAVIYTDEEGTKHVMGLTMMEIRAPADPRTIAGDVVDVTVLGLGIFAGQANSGLILGYGREISAGIRDNALVVGNPMQAIQSPAVELRRRDNTATGELDR